MIKFIRNLFNSSKQQCNIPFVNAPLLSDEELENVINEELEKLGYDVTGDKTSEFTDGFVRGYRCKEAICNGR
jgi:hypothetical protein